MPEWTQQQRCAIDTRGRSIIVSAAAGSGKTAVLVERLLRILSDYAHPVPADRMIVVTFTNDAAAQMKQRLAKALTARLSGMKPSPEYEWLLEQRMRLSGAKIATIHSFCFDLIREHAELLDVQPGFGIAEPGQESICQRQALDTVMERWTAKEPAMQLLFDHFCAKDDSDLETIILAVADHLESAAFPERWLRDAARLAQNPDALLSRMRRSACAALRDLTAFYREGLPFADHALTKVDPKKGNAFRQKADAELAALDAQLAYLETASPEEICAEPLARSCEFSRFPGLRSGVDEANKLAFRQITELVKERYAKITAQMLEPLHYFQEDAALTASLIPTLLDLVKDYLQALRREKNARNLLAFSDAEELTLRLLAEQHEDGTITRTPLAVQLAEQYDLIMVDEYQDTNNKQDCIFKLLSRRMRMDADVLHYGENVFLVGDVKQSIYSFRQANPENFRRAISESEQSAPSGDGMQLIRLNQNFRSAPGVLEFVNALFSAVMREGCGEVAYTEDEQLNFGSATYRGFAAKTQLLLADDSEPLPDRLDLQAECVADTIASMIGKTPVLQASAGGIVTERPAVPGDFCILLRSVTGDGEAFAEALRRRGIGAAADADSGLLDLPEIHLIRCLLRIADNPLNDTAMAAVMLSPVGGFTAQELAQLKLGSAKRRIFLQMQELAHSEKQGDLSGKMQNFLYLLHMVTETAASYPLEEAIWEIYGLTDLPALQSIYGDDAAQKRAHLDAFARLAGEYRKFADLTAQTCLSGWLRYLDRLEEAGKKLEIRGGSQANGCVQIKTIHRSKGLQYPFVFAAKLDKPFSRNPSKAPVQASEDGLLGVRIYDRAKCICAETAAYTCLLNDVYQRQRSEELRLLYVALTRAEQQLFLVMDHPEGAKTKLAAAGKLGTMLELAPEMTAHLSPYAGSMQDWVLYFLFSGKDRTHLERLMAGEESSGAYADYRLWKWHPFEVQKPEVPDIYPDQEALSAMRRQLGATCTTAQSALVSKNSVTQLAHPETGVMDLMHRPQFTLEGTTGGLANLKGAERGTAVHKIMQQIDFSLAVQDVSKALARLLDEGKITETEAASIEPARLEAFFRSKLCQRIITSDMVQRERKIFVEIGELTLPGHPEIITPYRGTDGTMIGTIDLLFHEPDGWVILDYKTDHAASGKALIEEYSLQLALYRAAAKQILGEPVKELYLYAFALDRELEIAT